MRLICPNCGAQYEVDGTVIPDSGRDVQCSNCGHTWFQRKTAQEAEPETPPVPAAAPEPTDSATVSATDSPQDQDADTSPDDEIADTGPAPETKPETPQPTRQPLDAEVENVLRQEAELETSQRANDGGSLETQPDLGLNQLAAEPEPIFAERSAQLDQPKISDPSVDNSRRDLLPDIEEINSTLAASSNTAGSEKSEEMTEQRRRSGFRRGFLLAFLVFSMMALVYVYAPKIADAAPKSASALSAYVDWVNALRISVDNIMLGAIEKLTSLLAQINGDRTS